MQSLTLTLQHASCLSERWAHSTESSRREERRSRGGAHENGQFAVHRAAPVDVAVAHVGRERLRRPAACTVGAARIAFGAGVGAEHVGGHYVQVRDQQERGRLRVHQSIFRVTGGDGEEEAVVRDELSTDERTRVNQWKRFGSVKI